MLVKCLNMTYISVCFIKKGEGARWIIRTNKQSSNKTQVILQRDQNPLNPGAKYHISHGL